MPRYKNNWEAEYHDPISDAEDTRQAALEAEMNAEIMVEIEICRRMEEDREFAEAEHRKHELEMAHLQALPSDYEDHYEDHYEDWNEGI